MMLNRTCNLNYVIIGVSLSPTLVAAILFGGYRMLNETLIASLGSPLCSAVPIAGGDINETFRLRLEDGTLVFMKANTKVKPSFFQAEADGLEALRANGTISVP